MKTDKIIGWLMVIFIILVNLVIIASAFPWWLKSIFTDQAILFLASFGPFLISIFMGIAYIVILLSIALWITAVEKVVFNHSDKLDVSLDVYLVWFLGNISVILILLAILVHYGR